MSWCAGFNAYSLASGNIAIVTARRPQACVYRNDWNKPLLPYFPAVEANTFLGWQRYSFGAGPAGNLRDPVACIAACQCKRRQPATIALLAAGGVLYSIGVMFHLWERLPYQQPIWHCFVVAGAACHYAAIFGEIALPGTFT